MSLKEFPSDWSKLHHTQVKANIEYLLKNYKKYGVTMSDYDDGRIRVVGNDVKYDGVVSNNCKVRVQIGDDIIIGWNTKLDCYTINGRLVTSLTGTLYEPIDELFKACVVSYKTVNSLKKQTKTHRPKKKASEFRRNMSEWWNYNKPYVLVFGGLAVFLACAVMYERIDCNYKTTVQEKVKEKLQKEYPGYSEYEARKQQITDSIEDCTNKFSAWRNREKGD